MIPFKYARGATISLSGNVVSGDPTGWVGTADLREVTKEQATGRAGPYLDGNEPLAATFDVAFIAAVGSTPARYALSIDAADAATITGDYFLADIRLVNASNVAYSALVAIQLTNVATPTP